MTDTDDPLERPCPCCGEIIPRRDVWDDCPHCQATYSDRAHAA